MCQLTTRYFSIFFCAFLPMAISGCTNAQDGSRSSKQNESIETKQSVNSKQQSSATETTKTLADVTDLKIQREEQQTHAQQLNIVLSGSGRGVAYIAQKNGTEYVVHNGKRKKNYAEISNLVISPDGMHVAFRSKLGTYQLAIVDDHVSQLYKIAFAAVYSPDSMHVAYLAVGLDGVTYVVLDGKPIDGVHEIVSAVFQFSHDSGKLLYHVRPSGDAEGYLVLYDIRKGTKTVKKCLDSTDVVMNKQSDRIAAVVMDGGRQTAVHFAVASPDKVTKSKGYDEIHDLSFGHDGMSLAFVAVKGGRKYLVANGRESMLPADMGVVAPPVIRRDGRGAGLVLQTLYERGNYFIFYQTGNEMANDARFSSVRDPVYSASGTPAFAAMSDGKYFVVINGKKGPPFDAVVEPLFTPDGTKLVYRARKADKRMIVIADAGGGDHRPLQEYEMVFPVSIGADGKSISYGVKEDNRLIWKVEKL